jgi:DNA-binding NarL/FixJ family response regulator
MKSKSINILVAHGHFLVAEGLKCFLSSQDIVNSCKLTEDYHSLEFELNQNDIDIVVLDYTCDKFNFNAIELIKLNFPNTKILAITPHINKITVLTAIKAGINSHLLNECDKDEVIQAIEETIKGNKFYCGKILDTIVESYNEIVTNNSSDSIHSCDGTVVSEREIHIIALIAEGFSNKQIADKLCISLHTVNTHRKNIMSKLGVNNTAGIVLYAVREQILNPNKYLFS